MSKDKTTLAQISVDRIERNQENPRVIFRPEEMQSLIESIHEYGVQVPISVYKKGSKFIIIDGERRWRASMKLNRSTIPAIIQEEPTRLNNLLLMFNIHALREQWDYFTIARKLPDIIELLVAQLEKVPTERDLAAKTGLGVHQIRRCKLLMELPDEYKDMILDELNKPKAKQKLTEDMFIEMERSLKRVENVMPQVVKKKDRVRHVLIEKYREGVIENIVDFRLIAKVASAAKVAEGKTADAQKALSKLFEKNDYSARTAFQDSVSDIYFEKDFLMRINSVSNRIDDLEPDDLDAPMKDALRDLGRKIRDLLEG
jgi:ParB family chromosome partitioning protein